MPMPAPSSPETIGCPPRFLYGTAWKEDATRALTTQAIALGFRGIDTANQRKHYFEQGVGQAVQEAIAAGIVRRDQLFLQTKFTFLGGQDHRLPYDPGASVAEQVAQSFASSCEHLGTDYVDSLVLHGPSRSLGLGPADWEAWSAMEGRHQDGKARALGVSNVSLDQLRALCDRAVVRPGFVQNRCYAVTGWDRAVRRFCTEQGIVYQGFSLLTANRPVLSHGDLRAIAARHSLTPEQTVFRFALDLGMLPLTGTTQASHMRADLAALEATPLDSDEVERLEKLFG